MHQVFLMATAGSPVAFPPVPRVEQVGGWQPASAQGWSGKPGPVPHHQFQEAGADPRQRQGEQQQFGRREDVAELIEIDLAVGDEVKAKGQKKVKSAQRDARRISQARAALFMARSPSIADQYMSAAWRGKSMSHPGTF